MAQLAEFTAFDESLSVRQAPLDPPALFGATTASRPVPLLSRDPREDSAGDSNGAMSLSLRRQSSFSSSMKRKMSMMLPGSFQGNDFDNEEQLLEAPSHRGATSAIGFLRFLTEEGMGKMREAWGSRFVTAQQFVDLVEPILRESATDFFDEMGGTKSDVWTAEGWISSVQRAALQLRQHNETTTAKGRRKSTGFGGGRLSTQLFSSPPVSRQQLQSPSQGEDLFSPVRNRRDVVDGRANNNAVTATGSGTFDPSDDDDEEYDNADDAKRRAPRLSRLASTMSIRAFLGSGGGDGVSSASPAATSGRSTGGVRAGVPPAAVARGGDSRGSVDLNEDSVVIVDDGILSFLASTGAAKAGTSPLSSPQLFVSPSSNAGSAVGAGRRSTGAFGGRRASGFFSPPAGGTRAAGGESELRQYLRNLFAYIDHKRTHRMPWEIFSSFLVNGITKGGSSGESFRGGATAAPTTAAGAGGKRRGGGHDSPPASPGGSPRQQSDVDDGDDDDEESRAADSDEEINKALFQYKVTQEIPLPSSLLNPLLDSGVDANLATNGSASAATAVPVKRDWVLKLRYLEDIDKMIVVMKYAVTFLDPHTLPGGGGTTAMSATAAAGGVEPQRPLSSSMKLNNSMNATTNSTVHSVIGSPTPSCLPLHVIPSSSRISTALFLPDPFWAMVVFDTDRGVSSIAVWQYQVAPARPPELVLKTKLFSSCSDSCMITCCLYTKPVTEAERLGLESALTLLECVLLLGTRDGRVLALTIVKNNTNASKPTYSTRQPVPVGQHKDVVTTMLHLQHSGCICTASLDSVVRILERKKSEYKVKGTLKFHKLGVTSLAYARDSLTLFTAGHDGLVAAWSENQWGSPSYILQDNNHPPKGSIVSIQCIPQTNVVASFDSGGMLRFYDTRDRRVVFDLSVVDPQVIESGIVKREDLRKDVDEGGLHTTAALGVGGTVNTKRTAGIGLFSGMCFTGAIHRQFLFAGSHMYIAIASEELKRNPLCTYDLHKPVVHASLSSVFGLVTASNSEISLWSLKNGMPDTRHRNVTASAITAVTCRPTTDVILLGLVSGDITAVQTSTGTVLQQYKCHDQTIAGLSLHPTKPILVSACRGVEGLLCVWQDANLLSMRSSATVQNSITQSVHPQQVVPLTAVHPAMFVAFDPSGTVIAVASPQRIVFYAQHPRFQRWVDVQSIHHGNLTEMNAFAWLDTRPRDIAPSNSRGPPTSAIMESSTDNVERFRIFVGDGRGYVVLWELKVDLRADDLGEGSSHILIHLGNNVSTTDRFFAAKRQKLKALARQTDLIQQKRKHRLASIAAGSGGGGDVSFETFGSIAVSQSIDDSTGAVIAASAGKGPQRSPGATPPPAATLSPRRHGGGAGSSALLNAHSMLDDLGDVSDDPELRALVERQNKAREDQLRGNDPASRALRKRLRARQSWEVLTKRIDEEQRSTVARSGSVAVGGAASKGIGGRKASAFHSESSVEEIRESSAQMQLQKELELIRTEAALRERRRAEEEELLLACRSGDTSAAGEGSASVMASDTRDEPSASGPSDASRAAPPTSRQAERKKQDRRRRLTKAGLFSMAQLQQMELAAASPTLSTMDRQLAVALEQQQHNRTQAIKHFHPTGPTQAISGEELLAPPILCIAADAIYPFLLYTGDESGRLIVWYVGSADPFLTQQDAAGAAAATSASSRGEAVSSWLKEPQPVARTSPHGEGVSIVSVSSCRKPFHAVLSWGSDNCVMLSTWSGLVLGRFQQGPIQDRRWALGPLLTNFNEKSFTVQLMWMKLKRFVLEGFFSAARRGGATNTTPPPPKPLPTPTSGAVVGSAFALAVEKHRQATTASRAAFSGGSVETSPILPPPSSSGAFRDVSFSSEPPSSPPPMFIGLPGGSGDVSRSTSTFGAALFGDGNAQSPSSEPLKPAASNTTTTGSRRQRTNVMMLDESPTVFGEGATASSSSSSAFHRQASVFCGDDSSGVKKKRHQANGSSSSSDEDDGSGGSSGSGSSQGKLGTNMRRRASNSSQVIARKAPPKVSMPGGLRRPAQHPQQQQHTQPTQEVHVVGVAAAGAPPGRASPPPLASQSPTRHGHQQQLSPEDLRELAAQQALEGILRKRKDLAVVGQANGITTNAVVNVSATVSSDEDVHAPDDDTSRRRRREQRRIAGGGVTPSWLSDSEGDLVPPAATTSPRLRPPSPPAPGEVGASTFQAMLYAFVTTEGSPTRVPTTIINRHAVLSHDDGGQHQRRGLPPPSPLVVLQQQQQRFSSPIPQKTRAAGVGALTPPLSDGGGLSHAVSPAPQHLPTAHDAVGLKQRRRRGVPLPSGRVLTLPSWVQQQQQLPHRHHQPSTLQHTVRHSGSGSDDDAPHVTPPPSVTPAPIPVATVASQFVNSTITAERERLASVVAGKRRLLEGMLGDAPTVARAASSMDVLLPTGLKKKTQSRTPQSQSGGGDEDEEDEVERAIREMRDKKRDMQRVSRRVEVNKMRHDAVHATQVTLRQTLAEIDKIRSQAALGRTVYYTGSDDTVDGGIDAGLQQSQPLHRHVGESDASRIVFTRRAIISQITPTAGTAAGRK